MLKLIILLLSVLPFFPVNAFAFISASCEGQCKVDDRSYVFEMHNLGLGGKKDIKDCPSYSIEYKGAGDGLLYVSLFQNGVEIDSGGGPWPDIELTGKNPQLKLKCYLEQ